VSEIYRIESECTWCNGVYPYMAVYESRWEATVAHVDVVI